MASGQRTKKIFVGGLAATVDEGIFRGYFEEFGTVEDAVVMYDHDNRRPRGFGFITFTEEDAVDKVFTQGAIQVIHEKQVEIKRAVPRDSMPPSPRAAFRGPPPQGSPYMEGHHSPYIARSVYAHSSPMRGDGGYGSPQGFSGRGRGDPGRSPMGGGSAGNNGSRGRYTPPSVVTGIPAAMASTGGHMSEGGVAAGPVLPPSIGAAAGMVGLQANMNPGGLQSPPPPHLIRGYAMQNGMQAAAAAAGQMGIAGSPPFSLEAQQAQQGNVNLADVQQQLSLTSVSDALEQLQHQQHQAVQQQNVQQQQQSQATTTIWS